MIPSDTSIERTIVFTDFIETAGATADTLASTRRLFESALLDRGGEDVRLEGTNCLAAFVDPASALDAALAAHAALDAAPFHYAARTGVHTGQVVAGQTGYVGLALNEAARVCYVTPAGNVLTTEVTLALLGSVPAVHARSVGRHRLKDFPMPMELFAVAADAAQQAAFHLGSGTILSTAELPGLVGRDDVLGKILDALEGDTPVISIAGPPGVGKTLLALHAAAAMATRFADGVFHVDTSNALLADDAVRATAAVLGGRPDGDALESLRAVHGDKARLLVIDGAECLVGHASVVEQLVGLSGKTKLLFTSCHALDAVGEAATRLVPLAEGEDLLRQRVAAQGGEAAALGAEDGKAIVAASAGLPEAIDLAARALVTTAPADVLRGLEAPTLQETAWLEQLATRIDRIYRRLDPGAAELFRRLATLKSPFAASDVERECAGGELAAEDILPLIQRLVAYSLVQPSGDGHLDLLPPIRRFAAGATRERPVVRDSTPPLLDVRNLGVSFATPEGKVVAVRDVSFQLRAGETLGIVGESGSGKTVAMQTLLGLTRGASVTGEAWFEGNDLLTVPAKQLRNIRGGTIGMIFQDARAGLHPFYRVGSQIAEVIRVHDKVSRRDAWRAAVDLLRLVDLPFPEELARCYPHELSGGMCQRVMIAIGIACRPKVLIADEPTTALDATIQAQVIDLLRGLQQETGMALIIVTHDLGVIAQVADEVTVMYAGTTMESAPADDLFYSPHHPYTTGLLRSVPRGVERGTRLSSIPGQPPSLINLPAGCCFRTRCPFAMEKCAADVPPLEEVAVDHASACWLPGEYLGTDYAVHGLRKEFAVAHAPHGVPQ